MERVWKVLVFATGNMHAGFLDDQSIQLVLIQVVKTCLHGDLAEPRGGYPPNKLGRSACVSL